MPLASFLQQSNALIAHDVAAPLGQITVPTQITYGRRDAGTSTRFADRLTGAIMLLRYSTRKKDGEEHHHWSLVENRRVADGRVIQRHVLYLGEINDEQPTFAFSCSAVASA